MDERLKNIENQLLPLIKDMLKGYLDSMAAHEQRLMTLERDTTRNAPGRLIYTDGPWFLKMETMATEWIEFKARSQIWKWIERAVPTAIALAALTTSLRGGR